MKGASTIKCINISIIYSQCGNIDPVKALAHNCLHVMTEKWRKCLDNGDISGAILSNLSKPFDCILHESWVLFPIDNKEQKSIMHLVVTLKFYMEFHKGQFWVSYFLMSISVPYVLI